MPTAPYRPEALAWQTFRGSTAVAQRLLTPSQLRSSAWIRVRHDVYADARLDRDHGLACRAAALRLPAEAVIAGPSAAYLHGVEHAASFTDDVHVVTPTRVCLGSARRLRVHQTDLLDADVQLSGGLPRTVPARTAWELAAWFEPMTAVPIIDSMLAHGLMTRSGLTRVAAVNRGRPGGRRASGVLALADAGAQSPPESRLRVKLVLAGLPQPVTQHPIRLPIGVVLHPDLAWPAYRVAVEYDGQVHSSPDQLHLDRRRLNQLVNAGWLVLHVTSRRLSADFPGILREVRQALWSQGWRP